MNLRSFLKRLDEAGQLNTIEDEVDWNLQAGALGSMSNRVGGPAIHFKRIKGYPSGFSLTSGLFTGPKIIDYRRERPWSRQAIALELDPKIDYDDFLNGFLMQTAPISHVPSIVVSSGPCKENVMKSQEVDVQKLPIPLIHQGDGGRYINCSITIAMDPETKWQYWGWHRWMVVGKDLLTGPLQDLVIPIQPVSPMQILLQKHGGVPMPCVIVIGGSPACMLSTCVFTPPGADKSAIAGGLQRDPVPLVKAETSNILVPSDAEIVIEGEINPTRTALEGPYPEYVRWSPQSPQPVFQVRAVTYRNEPVLPFVAEGGMASDRISLVSTVISLEIYRYLKMECGIPVAWVSFPVEAKMALCVVALHRVSHGMPAEAAYACFSHPASCWFDKVLIVDSDVEPGIITDIMNSWVEKTNPAKDYHFMKGPATYLSSYSNSDERNSPIATKMYIDATYPLWWEKSWLGTRLSFETCFPEEIQKRVLERWKEVGLPGEPYIKKCRTLM